MFNVVARAQIARLNAELLSEYLTNHAPKHGIVYHPRTHAICAVNTGSYVRPEIVPVRVNASGVETVESFMARGGSVTKLAPSTKYQTVAVVKSRPTRFATSRG